MKTTVKLDLMKAIYDPDGPVIDIPGTKEPMKIPIQRNNLSDEAIIQVYGDEIKNAYAKMRTDFPREMSISSVLSFRRGFDTEVESKGNVEIAVRQFFPKCKVYVKYLNDVVMFKRFRFPKLVILVDNEFEKLEEHEMNRLQSMMKLYFYKNMFYTRKLSFITFKFGKYEQEMFDSFTAE